MSKRSAGRWRGGDAVPAWVDTPMVQQATEQVANEILQAAREGKRDLTLAPNPDIHLLIELTKTDPDRTEDGAGFAFQRRAQG